jgi:hypothetical protein
MMHIKIEPKWTSLFAYMQSVQRRDSWLRYIRHAIEVPLIDTCVNIQNCPTYLNPRELVLIMSTPSSNAR